MAKNRNPKLFTLQPRFWQTVIYRRKSEFNLHSIKHATLVLGMTKSCLKFIFATDYCSFKKIGRRRPHKQKRFKAIFQVSDSKRAAINWLHYSRLWVTTKKLDFQSNNIVLR